MAWEQISRDKELSEGQLLRTHLKIDAPFNSIPFLDDLVENWVAWIKANLSRLSREISNRLTREEIQVTDSFSKDKGNWRELVIEYKVVKASPLIASTIIAILTSWQFWVGLGIFASLITITHRFTETTSGKIGTAIGLGTVAVAGLFLLSGKKEK